MIATPITARRRERDFHNDTANQAMNERKFAVN
jgi:hypothetical protein